MGKRKSGKENNSLDEFIAAYKRGDVTVGNNATPAAQKPAPAPLAAPPAAQAAPAKREAFVSGPTKLAYLACKTGLRDHHIFAHVQLSALSTGATIDPTLTRGGVDLLICNANMSAVAVIDLLDTRSRGAASAKNHSPQGPGIRPFFP